MSKKRSRSETPPVEEVKSGPASDSFSSLALDRYTAEALSDDFKFDRMTDVQRRSIPAVLAGRDVLVQAKTGSGKTLAFAVPTVTLLIRAKFLGRNGTGAIVVAPTRELAAQIYDVFHRLMRRTAGAHKVALVHGGTAMRPEQEALAGGANVVVGTPGRLLAHLNNASQIGWNVGGCLMVVLDEADKLLQSGFDSELRSILAALPPKRQTCLFSATQSDALDSLAKVAFVSSPLLIEAKGLFNGETEAEHADDDAARSYGLTHGYVVVKPAEKFSLLYTFLRMTEGSKCMLFVASCSEAKYLGELLQYLGVKGVHVIHGKIQQQKRSQHLAAFRRSEGGLLVATDVAARGLDIPRVDWIVQYDAPGDVTEYVHRVGRTARAGAAGQALLFLFDSEKLYLKYVRSKMPSIEAFEFDKSTLNTKIQKRYETLVDSNFYLRQSAEEAYRGFLASYASHTLRDCFNVGVLDFKEIGLVFGLRHPPPPPGVVLEVARRGGKRAKKEDTLARVKDGRLPGEEAEGSENEYGGVRYGDRGDYYDYPHDPTPLPSSSSASSRAPSPPPAKRSVTTAKKAVTPQRSRSSSSSSSSSSASAPNRRPSRSSSSTSSSPRRSVKRASGSRGRSPRSSSSSSSSSRGGSVSSGSW